MKSKPHLLVVLVLAIATASSCADRSKEPNVAGDTTETEAAESDASDTEEAADSRTTSSVSGYSTVADECVDRACSVNAECCAGQSCGFDPSRSRVQRYCLDG